MIRQIGEAVNVIDNGVHGFPQGGIAWPPQGKHGGLNY